MKESMTAFDFKSAERSVISDPGSRSQIKDQLVQLQHRADYVTSRFIDDHPDFEKSPLKHKFYTDKTDTYAKITRLLRVISAYEQR